MDLVEGMPYRRDGMRGLATFISDVKNCESEKAEIRRIKEELAKIRSKFKEDKTLDGYQRKKCVCKLLFIFLRGIDINFGHMEAANLLSSNEYKEKQMGYLFFSVLQHNTNSELTQLLIQSIKNDLTSRNPAHVNLALKCIANIGSKEMAEEFVTEILRLLVSDETIDGVKQSAALSLLRLFRAHPEILPSAEWTSGIIHLLNDQELGVVTAACSLIEDLVKRDPDAYKGCVSLAVDRLSKIVTSSCEDLQDYTYHSVPAPWLSVKLLKLLQHYTLTEDPILRGRLNECLETILNKAEEPPMTKNGHHLNGTNAVLFEAVPLIMHSFCEPNLQSRACNQLGKFLSHRETNLRYIALESMRLLAASEYFHEEMKKYQKTVSNALKREPDESVIRRAADLLHAMCDHSNVEEIVQEMLRCLEDANYSIGQEMVVKIAILADKYATDYCWYVDVILNLIQVAGDHVSEEIWYRVIQVVVNREEVRRHAAKTVLEALQAPACHETMVKVGGYILGEFGNLIATDSKSSPKVQLRLLHSKYRFCSVATRALLLNTYIKFVNLFPEIKPQIQEVFKQESNIRSVDAELQQRASEYLRLSVVASTDVLAKVLEKMPPFPERETCILGIHKKNKTGRTVKSVNPSVVIKEEGSGSGQANSINSQPYPGSQQQQNVIADACICSSRQKTECKAAVHHINKLFEPSDLTADTFLAMWKMLEEGAHHESQKIFKAAFPMDTKAISAKLSGLGMQLLKGTDQISDSFVCATDLHTKTEKVSCLLWLELNREKQIYRLTVRARKESVANLLTELLAHHF